MARAWLLVFSLLPACAPVFDSEMQSALKVYSDLRRPGLKIKHDEFTGESSAHTPFMLVGDQLELTALGTKGAANEQIVWIYSRSEDWKYLRCHSLHWLVDGRPSSVRAAGHDGNVYAGAVGEDIQQRLSDAGFLRLATAQDVRGRVCNTEFRLQPAQVAELRSLAAWMGLIQRPPSRSPTPAAPRE